MILMDACVYRQNPSSGTAYRQLEKALEEAVNDIVALTIQTAELC